jgi:hypothetical protein
MFARFAEKERALTRLYARAADGDITGGFRADDFNFNSDNGGGGGGGGGGDGVGGGKSDNSSSASAAPLPFESTPLPWTRSQSMQIWSQHALIEAYTFFVMYAFHQNALFRWYFLFGLMLWPFVNKLGGGVDVLALRRNGRL